MQGTAVIKETNRIFQEWPRLLIKRINNREPILSTHFIKLRDHCKNIRLVSLNNNRLFAWLCTESVLLT